MHSLWVNSDRSSESSTFIGEVLGSPSVQSIGNQLEQTKAEAGFIGELSTLTEIRKVSTCPIL